MNWTIHPPGQRSLPRDSPFGKWQIFISQTQPSILLITYFEFILQVKDFKFILFRLFCKLQWALVTIESGKKQWVNDDKEETKARLGQAACKCQTQTLESYRSCASKHPKFWVLEICPHLLVISPYYLMQSSAELLFGSASLLRLSCINQTVLPFSFLCVHHLAEWLSPTNNFSLSYPDFREVFSHFHHQGTLFFIPMKTTLHLASSSRCGFGTRSLWELGSGLL